MEDNSNNLISRLIKININQINKIINNFVPHLKLLSNELL